MIISGQVLIITNPLMQSLMQLRGTDLHLTYPGNGAAVIENLSFTMSTGFNAVFGPSGVGKTSFAKILSNAYPPSQGQLETLGIDHLLYTYNLERLPGWAAIGKHLDRVTPEGSEKLKDELLTVFGLGDILNQRFSQLSMGQQNRINLIRYLLQPFDLPVMDESLANVDEALRENIILTIKARFPEKMFIYISHHLVEVSKFCDQILVFANPATRQRYAMIKGLNHQRGDHLDKKNLDRVMLEIMNAF